MKAKIAQRPVRRQAAVAQRAVAQRAPARIPSAGPALSGGLDPSAVFRLQAVAGNQAVGQLLGARGGAFAGRPLSVQLQAVACPPPPAPVESPDPKSDPKFQAVTSKVKAETKKQKAHPPAKDKAAEASGAALGPTDEVVLNSAAAKVDDMSQQKPKGFDKAAFIASVHAAIEKATPKNMKEVDDFSKSDKAGELKGQVVGQVGASKDASAKDIKDATGKPPDPSGQTAKPVTPMAPETPGAPPANVNAGAGMPSPKPADQVSLDSTKCETDGQLAEAHVTKEQ